MLLLLPLASLAALVAAAPAPYAQLDPTTIPLSLTPPIVTATVPTVISTSLNVPITVPTAVLPTGLLPPVGNMTWTSRRRWSHWEPIPIFSKSCDCPNVETMARPCWATDALQRCNFEENHSWMCWTSANYGCPSPTRTCKDLFEPTPVTGKHPCDLGPGPQPTPEPTAAPVGF